MEDINREVKKHELFIDDNAEDIFYKIELINDARELFDIFGIIFYDNDFKKNIKKSIEQLKFDFFSNIKNIKLLKCFQEYNPEFYNNLFEQNYNKISKIDRLHLWLHKLNPYYNYLEFVKSAWQLSNDERKLLNKRIKEHAKDERLQKFIDQIKYLN